MSETKKLRFLTSRGYNGAIIARGALIDVTEPWASRFISDGTAIEEASKVKADEAPKKAADSSPAEKKPKSAAEGKKKHG